MSDLQRLHPAGTRPPNKDEPEAERHKCLLCLLQLLSALHLFPASTGRALLKVTVRCRTWDVASLVLALSAHIYDEGCVWQSTLLWRQGPQLLGPLQHLLRRQLGHWAQTHRQLLSACQGELWQACATHASSSIARRNQKHLCQTSKATSWCPREPAVRRRGFV